MRSYVWAETHPDQCPNGHPWHTGQGAFRVGWGNRPAGKKATGDHGRRQWTCQTCDADIDDDGVSWPSVSVPQDELARTNLGRPKRA
jgi:hypothetical protein